MLVPVSSSLCSLYVGRRLWLLAVVVVTMLTVVLVAQTALEPTSKNINFVVPLPNKDIITTHPCTGAAAHELLDNLSHTATDVRSNARPTQQPTDVPTVVSTNLKPPHVAPGLRSDRPSASHVAPGVRHDGQDFRGGFPNVGQHG